MADSLPESESCSVLTSRIWRRGRRWTWTARVLSAATAAAFTAVQFFPPAAFAQQPELPDWLKEDRGGWVSADQADHLQRADQALLQHLSTIEESRQRFITTHPSGVQAQYAGQELVVARGSDGNLLFVPTLDSKQQIHDGTLLLKDGTLQIVQNGRLVREVAPDGGETVFRADGLVQYEVSASGIRTDYNYIMASDGTVSSIIRTTALPAGTLRQEYDSQGRLNRATYPDGKELTFEAGLLVKAVIGPWTYQYAHQPDANGTLRLVLAQISDAAGAIYTGSVETVRWWKIADFYRTLLGRTPGVSEVGWWVAQPLSLNQIQSAIESSPEGRRNVVRGYYREYLGREASDAEANYWASQSLTLGQIEGSISGSPEGRRNAVRGYYREYLAREASDAEANYWASQSLTLGQIEGSISGSPEGRRNAVRGYYREYLGRAAGTSEVEWWATQSLSLETIRNSIRNSSESNNRALSPMPRSLIYSGSGQLVQATLGDGRTVTGGQVAAGGYFWAASVLHPDAPFQQQAWPITPDRIAPVGTLTGQLFTNQRDVTFTLATSDPSALDGTTGSGVVNMRFSLDGGKSWSPWEPFAATRRLTLPQMEGQQQLWAQFQDAAGNVSAPITRTITLDTVAPQMALTSTTLTNRSAYSLSYTVDGVAKTESVTLVEGSNVLTRTAADLAGNVLTATWTITLDTVAPKMALTSGTLTNRSAYTLSYTVDGVAQTEPVTLVEGPNVFMRPATDLAGNSSTGTWTITLDTVAPQIALTSGTLTNRSSYTLSYTVDGVAKTEPVTLVEGPNMFVRPATDLAGNTSTATWTITLDTAPPMVSLTSKTLVTTPAYQLVYEISDNHDGVQQLTESVTLQEGKNVLTRTVRDAAGNEFQALFTITLDSLGPSGTVAINAAAPYTKLRNVTLTLAADDPSGLTMRFSMDQGVNWSVWEPFAVSKTLTLPAGDGQKEVRAELKDSAGLTSTFSDSIILDATAPSGSILVNGNATYTNSRDVTLTLTATDATSGVSEMHFRMWPLAWSAWEPFAAGTRSFTLSSGDGNKWVDVEFRDAAGNVASRSDAITLDTVPPQLALSSSTLTNRAGYTLSYSVDGTARTESVTLAEGSNVFTRTATDAAGNASTATWTITLDTVAPKMGLTSGTLTNRSAYSLSYTVDGAAKTESVTLVEGSNVLTRKATDAAGNSSTGTWTITLDTVAPTLALSSPSSTDQELYAAQVKADGINLPSDTWRLGRGAHQIIGGATDLAGNSSWARLSVTRTGDLPIPTDPPQAPTGETLTQTLSDGSIATYISGQLTMVTTADGTRLIAPTLDSAGKVTSGWLVTADGTTTYLQGGLALWSRDSFGAITWYFSDGRPEAIHAADGSSLTYAYRLDSAGQVMAVLVTTQQASALFDSNGKLLEEIRADGRRLTYTQGRLTRIESAGQVPIHYTESVQPDGSILSVRPELVEGQTTDQPRRWVYAADGTTLREVTQPDGTIVRLTAGVPTEMVQPDGTVVALSVSAAGDLSSQFSITRSNLTRTYDAQGVLTGLTLADQSVVAITNNALQSLNLPDGTQVSDGVFDSQSHLVSGLVTLPDGRTVRYVDGQPTEARLPDGTLITYSAGQPTGMTLPDGLSYTLTLRQAQGDRPAEWQATLVNPDGSPFVLSSSKDERLTQMVYSDDWTLQQATRSDGAALTYAVIASPGGAKQSRLSTLTQTNGAVISYAYDSSGRLANTVAVSADPAESPIRTEYAYDKIRRVLKVSGTGTVPDTIFEYSYEFAADGSEITVVKEVATGLIKRYQNGLLISQTDPDGAVTAYDYTTDPDGYTDPYQTAIEAAQTLPDGTTARYEPVSGTERWALREVTLPDGRRLAVSGSRVTAVVLPDGTQIEEFSGTSLLANGSFDSWPNGESVSPAGWNRLSGRAFGRVEGFLGGAVALYPNRDETAELYYELDAATVRGKTLTFGAWVKSDHFNKTNISIVDDAGRNWSATHSGDGQWHWFTATRTIDANATVVRITLVSTYNPQPPAGQGYADPDYFDGVILMEAASLAPSVLPGDLASFDAQLVQWQLPADQPALRRMVEQGTLKLIQPDALDAAISTAVGADQTLSDGTVAHYGRPQVGAPLELNRLTLTSGAEVTDFNHPGNPLSDHSVSSTPGVVGQAAQFVSSQTQFLNVADNPDLSMGNYDFAFAGWVYLDSKSDDMEIVTKYWYDKEYYLDYAAASDRFRFVVHSNYSTANAVLADQLGSPSLRQWYFITVWNDSASGQIGIQVNNGMPDVSAHSGGSYDGVATLGIGAYGDNGSFGLDGRIDELGFWKRTLTAAERTDLYNGGAGNTYSGTKRVFSVDPNRAMGESLVAYYNMEETSGSRADATDTQPLQPLVAQAALPTGRVSLRRMVEQGTLKLNQPANPVPGTVEVPGTILSGATVTYQGKPRETFTYSYSSQSSILNPQSAMDLTHVTDQTGTTRTYDGTKRLVAIDQPDGTQYAITYASDLSQAQQSALENSPLRTFRYTDLNGQQQTLELPDPDLTLLGHRQGDEVTIQHLTLKKLENGTELHYAFGRLESIDLPDGRIINNFTVDRNGIPLRGTLTLPDGTTKLLQNGALVEVTRDDSVKLRYRDNSLAEIRVPINTLQDVTVSRLGLTPLGALDSAEVLLPSGDRLTLNGGRFTAAHLSDGTGIQSVTVNQDQVTGATLSVNGSTATLNNSRDVGVTLPSGQQYLYRYKVDSAGQPTNDLETMTFRDDFEDGNSLGWRTVGDWSISGGDMRGVEMTLNDNHPSIYAQTGLNWADYTATTSYNYEQLTGKGSEARFLFRYQDDGNHYFVETIRRTSDPHAGWNLLLGGVIGGQSFQNQWIPLSGFNEGGNRTLSVEVRGSTFRVYLDGNYQGEFSDGRLSRGSIGYSVGTAIVRFHNLDVTFPGEDLRDPATREIDAKLRSLRQVVADAAAPIAQIGTVAAAFDPSSVDPGKVQILEASTDPDVQAAVSAVQTAAADPSIPLVSELNADGKVKTSITLDGSTTLYDNQGRPSARYDTSGRLQVTYSYDADGYLARVKYVSAREQLAQQIDLSRTEVERRSTAALEALAQQKGFSIQGLQAQVQTIREELVNQQSTLGGQLQNLEATDVKGKQGRQQKSQALDQLHAGVERIRQAQVELEQQYAQALSQLSTQVSDQNAQMESDTTSAFAQIDGQQVTFIKAILRQELEPILYQQYRIGIGRDPDETEITQVVDHLYAQAGNNSEAALDLVALKKEIQALPDYTPRVDEVAAIKQQVADWLTHYVQSPADRPELVKGLGLSPDEVVPLSASDVDRILQWLDSRSLHFGRSAFLVLRELLAASGVTVPSVDLAVQLILTDILVGVLNPKVQQTAELEISLFALDRVARLHGVNTTPSQISFADLRSLIRTPQSTIDTPLIAHINGNHYIVVTSIAGDGTVTYDEPSKGPSGQTLTIPQAEFVKQWKGVILSPRAPPHDYQKLTPKETQAITGSFFPLIIAAIIAIASTIGAAVSAVVAAIGAILASLGALLSGIFSAFGTALAGFFQGLGAIFSGNLLGGLATIGHGLFAGVTGLINAGLGFLGLGSLSQFGTLAGIKTALTTFALNTVLTTGINVAVSKGLEALGVSPTISSLVGAFASGGLTGALNPVGKTVNFLTDVIGGAVTSTAIAGTQLGLVKAGLDPTLASLAGVGVGTITHSLISGVNVVNPATGQITGHLTGLNALGYTLTTSLAPTLAGELAYYGIQRLGASIGLDPRIAVLAGMPIKAGIGNIANPATRGQGIVNSMWEGLKSGVVSVGVQAATQALNLDPFAGSLISRTLSGAISGAISPSHNVFQGVYDAFRQSVGNFSTIPPPPDPEDPRFITTLQDGSKVWNRAAYEGAIGQYEASRPVWMAQAMAKTNNFNDDIRQVGLAQAVENYATSIFHRDSVESLVQSFGSIKNAITQRMQQNKIQNVTLTDGSQAKKLSLADDKDLALLYKENPFGEISLLGLTEDEIDQRYYELRADRQTRTAGMADGTITGNFRDGNTVTAAYHAEVSKGDITKVTLQDASGRTFTVTPNNFQRLRLNSDGSVRDGILADITSGAKYYFQSGQQVGIRVPAISVGSKQNPFQLQELAPETILLPDVGIKAEDLKGISLELTQDPTTGQTQTRLVPTDPSDTNAIQRLQATLSKFGQQLQTGTEKLTNRLLLYGPSTNQELATHKASEVAKIQANPGQIYLIHTKTTGAGMYAVRLGTWQPGDIDNVNHTALGFQGSDGQVYTIQITLHGSQTTPDGQHTDIEVFRLQDWGKSYVDIEAQALPISTDEIQKFKDQVIFKTYVDRETMKPTVIAHYDPKGAILGAGAQLPLGPTSSQNICTNFSCGILGSAGIEIPGLPKDQYVTPDEVRHAVDAWIKRGQN